MPPRQYASGSDPSWGCGVRRRILAGSAAPRRCVAGVGSLCGLSDLAPGRRGFRHCFRGGVGAGIQAYHAGRAGDYDCGPSRQGRLDQFLGDVVPAVPRRDAWLSGSLRRIPGARVRRARHLYRYGRTGSGRAVPAGTPDHLSGGDGIRRRCECVWRRGPASDVLSNRPAGSDTERSARNIRLDRAAAGCAAAARRASAAGAARARPEE